MKRGNLLIFISFVFLCLSSISRAAGAAPTLVPSPPQLAANAYLLLDYNSGQILAEMNADQQVEPASLTKLMTAYAIFHELKEGNIHLTDQVTISEKAWRSPGSRMFVEVGKQVAVEDLLKGMIIQSGNDASIALAEYVAGSEDTFAALMNRHAQRLGLEHSHFVNATGLPHKDHYTTARDIAHLTRALITEFPEHYAWYSERSYSFNGITQYNRNKLLWRDESVDGVKTGHTESAGYCLVTSAQRGEMRLISVVMGTDSEEARARESQSLLNYGFRFFETHKLYSAGEQLTETRIWKGDSETLPLGLANDLYVTIPRGQYKKLNATMNIDALIQAPANKGDQFGNVNVVLEDQAVASQPLVALQSIPEGSLWQRLMDSALLLFE